MKKLAKNLVAAILGRQVKQLRAKNNFKIIAVAGSVGKTSTKLAIAQVLSQGYKVRHQDGNYNDLVSVPLIFFGQELPSIYNPFAWLSVFRRNSKVLKRPYPYEIVIVELSTDGPDQIRQFRRYLQTDITILTAITPEHMEFFSDLDGVAREEMAVTTFSDRLIVNKDLIAGEYLAELPDGTVTYGIKQPADFRLSNIKFDKNEASFDVTKNNTQFLQAAHEQITEPQLYSINAAVAVAAQLDMTPHAIEQGIRQIKPVNGRMRHLRGIKGSTIIDDTYNASPEAVRAALDTLYRIRAPQKIAILGNMNELGGYTQSEHQKIGEYCDHRELDLVLTIGPDANKYLAPAAKDKGCEVETFTDPYSAAEYLKPKVKEGAVILAKGSQNGVYAEEAVKLLLANPADSKKLVRQSKDWLKTKHKQFTPR